jgi:hypothetical protein
MKRVIVTVAALVLGSGAAARHAANGVLIVEKSTAAGTSATNQIQIEPNRMRVETTAATGSKQVVVFDGARGVLMMIDNTGKTYTEVTRDEAETLGAQMSDAMAQIQKQLESMPPAQRAQVEAMMKGRMGGAGAPPKIQYRKAGTGQVGKWTCDRYDGYEADKKTIEVCTVDPKVLGFTDADFAVSRQLADFFGKLVPQMRGQMFAIGDAEQQGFEGVPVRRVMTIGGREVTSEITDISRQSFDDAGYAPPAGYTKRPFMAGPGRGR